MNQRLPIIAFIVANLLFGCSSGHQGKPTQDTTSPPDTFDDVQVQDTTRILPDPHTFWDPGHETPDLPAMAISLLGDHGLSTWAFGIEHGDDPPAHMHLADFAVANGHVFSLIGHAVPFNTLHSMIGPDYQKDDGYFSDLWIEVAGSSDGVAFDWQREWIGRASRAPLVVTYAESSVLSLTVVDVAPFHGSSSPESAPGILRVALIANLTGEDLDGLWLRAACARPQEDLGDGRVREVRGGNLRVLQWLDGEDPLPTERALGIPVGPLPAGGIASLRLAAGTGESADEAGAALEALSVSLEEVFETTLAAWDHRLSQGVEIVSPDPRVNDYLTGAQIIVLSQIASTGAICPMSQYTRTWLRDCGGPVRYLSRSGFFAAARGIIDYLWLASAVEGGLRNSYRADLDQGLLATVDIPDWASQPAMTGRTGAESPSYIPLMYGWYVDASGDDGIIDGRVPMLEHSLMKQDFRDDLLPFSGDETFRTAMAIAHGLPVDESFEEGFLSANSSFLWVGAAEALSKLAVGAGRDLLAQELLERAKSVREAADTTYRLEDGTYTPYVHEADFSAAPAPYEDVNTKPIWSRYFGSVSGDAADNLDGTIDALGGEDGILVSPLPEAYVGWMGLPIKEGIYTGMSPGYFLQNLAAARHPIAEKAFNELQHHAAPGGSTPEYAALDGPHPLQLMYDPSGGEPADYTARYRPWEGAIVADAAIEYLYGIRQHAVDGRISVSPSLPNGWAWSEARGIRIGQTIVDIRVEHVGDTWTIRSSHVEGPAIELDIDLPWPDDVEDTTGALDGASVETTGWVNRWGVGILRVETFSLEPGTNRVLSIH